MSNAYDDGDQIEKRIIATYVSSGNRFFDTGYVLGDINDYSLPYDPENGDIRIIAWVRRTDGGIIDSSNWSGANFVIKYNTISIQTEIPENWYETTTQTAPTYTTATTIATTVDYEGFLTTMTVPQDVRYAVGEFEQLIYDFWNLHYISYIILLTIICALVAWLLH